MPLQLDYFYGNEAEQFTFYRIPKVLITSPQFKKLSDSSKILYGLMLDRMGLSIKNGWFDEYGRAYINFTLEDITGTMDCSEGKACKMIRELDVKKGVGLIEHIKLGQGKAAKIYLKKFIGVDNSQKYTRPTKSENQDFQKSKSQTYKNCSSRTAKIESADLQETECNNNKNNNTDFSNINPSIQCNTELEYSAPKQETIERRIDLIDKYKKTLSEVKAQIDYESLIISADKGIVDDIVNLMAEVMTLDVPSYKINGQDCPAEFVRYRFKEITNAQIDAFLLEMSCNPPNMVIPRAYMLTALFNIPDTANTKLSNRVNYDMQNGGRYD